MYILIFTRLTGHDEEAVFLEGVFDSMELAQDAMKKRYEKAIAEQGFERKWSKLWENQAVLGSYSMDDVIRLLIFDGENPYGFQNDRRDDWMYLCDVIRDMEREICESEE